MQHLVEHIVFSATSPVVAVVFQDIMCLTAVSCGFIVKIKKNEKQSEKKVESEEEKDDHEVKYDDDDEEESR